MAEQGNRVEYFKKYYIDNREKLRAKKGRKRSPVQLEKHREYMREYARKNPEYAARQNLLRIERQRKDAVSTWTRHREWYKRNREKVLDALGRSCQCCGESGNEFLSLDHIHGGGRRHRRQVGDMWRAVLKEGCPKDKYRILCYNCNMAMGHRKLEVCPHTLQPEYGITGC